MLKLLIDILEHDWNLNSNNQSIFENKHQWIFKFQIVFIYIQFIKKQLQISEQYEEKKLLSKKNDSRHTKQKGYGKAP